MKVRLPEPNGSVPPLDKTLKTRYSKNMEITQTLQAISAELARTGEDPLTADEIGGIVQELAELRIDYPASSAQELAYYWLYPQI